MHAKRNYIILNFFNSVFSYENNNHTIHNQHILKTQKLLRSKMAHMLNVAYI